MSNPATVPLGGAESLLRERTAGLLAEARSRTLRLIAPISTENLERVHDKLMSPLVWDLGHIAAFEDLWIGQVIGGRAPPRPRPMGLYDAFQTPRAGRRGHPPPRTAAAARADGAVRRLRDAARGPRRHPAARHCRGARLLGRRARARAHRARGRRRVGPGLGHGDPARAPARRDDAPVHPTGDHAAVLA